MLRRTLRRAFKDPYRQRPGGGNDRSPFETQGQMGDSFEKLLENIEKNNPFPVTQNMYDRVGVQQFSTNPADADKMPNKGKVGTPSSNRTSMGSGIKHELNDRVDFSNVTKSQLPWERAFNPKQVELSQLSDEYYYPAELTAAEKHKRNQLRTAVVIAGAAAVFVVYLVLITTNPQGRLIGGTLGNQEPTFGVPTKAPPGYEIVRLDPRDPTRTIDGKPLMRSEAADGEK